MWPPAPTAVAVSQQLKIKCRHSTARYDGLSIRENITGYVIGSALIYVHISVNFSSLVRP